MHRHHRHSKSAAKSKQQLDAIGDHHGPKAAGNGVNQHHGRYHHQQPDRIRQAAKGRATLNDAQSLDHLAHGQKGVADADAIDRQC